MSNLREYLELCRYAPSCREWDIQTPTVQLTTLCTSAWNSSSVDANVFAKTALVVGRHREFCIFFGELERF